MADVLTKEQRYRNMANIKGKNTKPELVVRSLVHRLGYRYRLHQKGLPGKPDLVFASRRKVIFVHGCFWHMHECRYGAVKPATNASFWETKRLSNVERDKNNRIVLEQIGWQVLVIWECQTRVSEETLAEIVTSFLS
jgi:DNA mismatch endonuclease (patch repair protein)